MGEKLYGQACLQQSTKSPWGKCRRGFWSQGGLLQTNALLPRAPTLRSSADAPASRSVSSQLNPFPHPQNPFCRTVLFKSREF